MPHSNLTSRKATWADLPHIISLLRDDELGKTRELSLGSGVEECYKNAFDKIQADSNQYLMVVEEKSESLNKSKLCIIATCHLTLMPSLTLQGSMRLAIEAVRVASTHRGRCIGEWMFQQAFDYANAHGASFIQLSTDKRRPRAKKFYERLGFEATHEGMKLSL